MIRRPPRSTLFPYTTLFRSLRPAKDAGVVDHRVQPAQAVHVAGDLARLLEVGQVPDDGRSAPVQELADRKSTRLNSSHANISYAVFCLKKKNTSISCHFCIL